MFKKILPKLLTTSLMNHVKTSSSLVKSSGTLLNNKFTSFTYPTLSSFNTHCLSKLFSIKIPKQIVEENFKDSVSVVVPSDKSSKPKQKTQAIKIELDEKDLIEKFIKGSGNGGQAINKTNSNVELTHIPTGIVVQCQKTRSQAQNRQLARKLLKLKLDDLHNGNLSKSSKKAAKVLKQRAKQKKRAKAKYQSEKGEPKESPEDSVASKENI